MTAAIVAFGTGDSVDHVELALAGGKAVNLVRLAAAGFPVPSGFVCTTDAYRSVVARNGLDAVVAEAIAGVEPDPDSLEAASDRIRAAFEAATVPTEVDAAIRTALAPLGDGPVAVRSSATAEDLADASFAGQQDTYLNVVGPDAVLDAVRRCWGSLWTARAIGYRLRAGISHDDVALAVVVQRQIASDASGVAFTADPLSGARNRVVIDATLGLGEALVSGQVVPDHVVCDPSGRVLERERGDKAVVTVPVAGGGVETVQRSGEDWALDDVQLGEVARLATRVAEEYGAPQDIEWAVADGRLWLLQARAITSLYPLPDAIDTADELGMWASFGAFQGMLEPITPIGQDALLLLIRGIYRLVSAKAATGTVRPDESGVLRVAGERLWVRMDHAYRTKLGRRIVPVSMSLADPAIGQILTRLDEPRWAVQGGALPPRGLRGLIRQVLPGLVRSFHDPVAVRERLERDCDRLVQQAAQRLGAAARLGDPVARLAARLTATYASLEEMFPVLLVRFGPIMPVGAVGLKVLRDLGGDEALQAVRSLDGNVTTEMDLALWLTAETIRADTASRDAVLGGPPDRVAAAYLAGTLPETATTALDGFLDVYGVRGIAEIDLGHPRWADDPSSVISSLQAYVALPADAASPDTEFEDGKGIAAAATERLVAHVRAEHGRVRAAMVRRLVRTIRGGFGARETPKFTLIREFGLVREALLASGQDLVDAGLLDEAHDVLFCHLADLETAFASSGDALRQRVAANRELYERETARRQVPRLILGDGRTFFEGFADEGGDLMGSPVSPGVVEGVVRVVLSPSNAGLAHGEILVCPGTDPAWTPLFLTAGGLITEVGGLMTHGAVVAREYGLPAIVGVHAATERLHTGQRIRLDGSTGRISLL